MQMDKDYSRQFKTMREVIKKKRETLVKGNKKLKKNINKPELLQMRKDLACETQDESVKLCEQEKMCLREISRQERSIYTTIAAGLKPVIGGEFSILGEVEQLAEVLNKMNKIILDPFKDFRESENKTSFVDNI